MDSPRGEGSSCGWQGGSHSPPIKNLVARGTIKGKSYVGGIAGGTNGGSNNAQKTTLENCGNEATVTATGVNAGAMIGVNMGGSASFIFRNCYNVGAINGGETGALSGWSGGGWSQFYNCYNAGKVNGGSAEDFSRNNGTGFNNCYNIVVATLGCDLLQPSVSAGNLGVKHGGTDDGTHAADSRRGGLWDDEDE